MIIATCDEWIPNEAKSFALNLLVATATTYICINIHIHNFSWTPSPFDGLVTVFPGDIKPRPPAVITPKCAMFMFKDKNEIENLRFTEWNSLSKFAHQLGAKDRFKLSPADFKGGSSPTTVSCFSASSSMLRLTSGLAKTYQQLVGRGFLPEKFGLLLSD